MARAKIFDIYLLYFLAGVSVFSFAKIDVDAFGLFLAAAIALLLGVFAGAFGRIRVLFFVIAIFFLGAWRYEIAVFDCHLSHICSLNGYTKTFEAIVVSAVKHKDKGLEFQAGDLRLLSENEDATVAGRILVYSGLYPDLFYGDKITFQCDLKEPEAFEGFAYDEYLARYGIYSVCFYPEIEVVGRSYGSQVKKTLARAKISTSRVIDRGLGEPEAGMLNAVLLGNKHRLDKELQSDMSRSGLSHIAAISGLHIGVLMLMAGQLLFAFGLDRRRVFIASVVLIGIYIFIIGAPASAVRAGIMGSLALLAICLGRLSSLKRIIILAASIIIFFNPLVLAADLGFQLSFTAVMGIALVLPYTEEFMNSRSVLSKYISASVIISASAQLLSWPIIAKVFGSVSLLSLVSNILVLWLLPFLLALSVLAIALSLVLPALANVFFLPTGLMLKYIIYISNTISELSFASFAIENLNLFYAFLYYLLVSFVFYGLNNKNHGNLRKF